MNINRIKYYSQRCARLATRTKNSLSKRICSRFNQAIGKLKGNGISTFYYTGCVNFGDLLTPLLLYSYGFTPYLLKNTNATSKKKVTEMVSVGSILGIVDDSYDGLILGSGFGKESEACEFKNAHVLALRGELTRRLLRCENGMVLGDPGLLAFRLSSKKVDPKYALGIIVHYVELERDIHKQKFSCLRDSRVKLIDPRRNPKSVINDVLACENILSSSLHGLIVADSFGIPNARVQLFESLILGGDFKFEDYYSALGVPHKKHIINSEESFDMLMEYPVKPSTTVGKCQERLHSVFSNLKEPLEEIRSRRNSKYKQQTKYRCL